MLSCVPQTPKHINNAELLGLCRKKGKGWDDKKLKRYTEWLRSPTADCALVDLGGGTRATARQWARPSAEPQQPTDPQGVLPL